MFKSLKKACCFILSLFLSLSTSFIGFTNADSIEKPKKPLIIIPGICGSELFASETQRYDNFIYEKGYCFWPPQSVIPFIDEEDKATLEDISALSLKQITNDLKFIVCNEDGSSKVSIMPSNPILDCRNNPDNRNFGTADCYKKLVNFLKQNINENEYQIIFFSYDWRQSNAKTALELEKFINQYNFDDITFLTHSMGGLVCASYLTKQENRNKVDKTICLGAPFLGSPKAFGAIDDGKFFDGIIGAVSAPVAFPLVKALSRNCQSVYELLPPSQYFDVQEIPYLSRKGSGLSSCCMAPREISTYEDSINFLTYGRSWTKNVDMFLKNAQNFHDSLYSNGKFILNRNDIKLYNISGYNLPTISQIIVNNKQSSIDMTKFSKQGDGTVLLSSSTCGNSIKNNLYIKNVSHMELISKLPCLKVISKILNNKEQTIEKTYFSLQ